MITVNTEAITYMIAYGLSAAASTRVSNEFGAGNIDQAKSAMAVSLKLTVLLVLIVVSTLAFGHNIWAGFFSDSPEIIKEFAPLTPFLAISITFDFVQGVLSGVGKRRWLAALGCGEQKEDWQAISFELMKELIQVEFIQVDKTPVTSLELEEEEGSVQEAGTPTQQQLHPKKKKELENRWDAGRVASTQKE
ncbi:hypothetical protein LWI28_004315 [Acer negundo]|uniref:Uncharacterized protein n=1 Tax=Acer negundo TaxID=4023 RepID=A0AAD5NWC9_ACENE|nr:hypothetical protein LWI28_004315 [Acer negundo]